MRILIVEDSARIRGALESGLRRLGYAVDVAADGNAGLVHVRTTEYDVVVLDIMMPGLDGLEMLRQARSHGVDASVLLLTARDSVQDRVTGLRAGADDYLVKPFAFEELVARIEALARRRHGEARSVIRVDDLVVNLAERRVTRGGSGVDLTPREYAILEFLAHREGRPVSRAALEEHIYDESSQVQSNAIDSAICSLRAKLNACGSRRSIIHTRRGVGYVLSGDFA